MTSKHVIVIVACGILLAAGCGSAPPPAPGSATPATTASETQHVIAGPVALDAPASWHVRSGTPNPSGDVTLAFLGPGELPDNCQASGQGGVCLPWPVIQLVPGGMVVAVRGHGMPGSEPPAGGDPIMVGGLSARRISGSADEACRAIGGSELIAIVVPEVAGTTGWMGIDACLAGGDVAAAKAAFTAIADSVTMVADAALPLGQTSLDEST